MSAGRVRTGKDAGLRRVPQRADRPQKVRYANARFVGARGLFEPERPRPGARRWPTTPWSFDALRLVPRPKTTTPANAYADSGGKLLRSLLCVPEQERRFLQVMQGAVHTGMAGSVGQPREALARVACRSGNCYTPSNCGSSLTGPDWRGQGGCPELVWKTSHPYWK